MARRARQEVKQGDLRKDKAGDKFIVLNVCGKTCHIREYGTNKQPMLRLVDTVKQWEYKGECVH